MDEGEVSSHSGFYTPTAEPLLSPEQRTFANTSAASTVVVDEAMPLMRDAAANLRRCASQDSIAAHGDSSAVKTHPLGNPQQRMMRGYSAQRPAERDKRRLSLKRNSMISLHVEDLVDTGREREWAAELVGEGLQLREQVEKERATRTPDLETEFPFLAFLLKITGLLRGKSWPFRRPWVWSSVVFVTCFIPFALSSALKECPDSCTRENRSGCGLCVKGLKDTVVNGYHTVAFAVVVLFLGRNLAWTLHEVTKTSSTMRELAAERKRFQYTTSCFCISIIWWGLLPVLGFYTSDYFISTGDYVVGISEIVRIPFAAALSAAMLGTLMNIMGTLALELKGIRAASKMGHGEEGDDMVWKQLIYSSKLHAAYHHANIMTQQAAVKIQILIGALFILAINASIAYMFETFSRRVEKIPDYASLLMIGNTIALNLCALILCGFAAHITSVSDSTIRSIANQFMFSMAGIMTAGESYESARVQQLCFLNDIIEYTKERGGFRILGQRITYSFFLVGFTIILGIANLVVSNVGKK